MRWVRWRRGRSPDEHQDADGWVRQTLVFDGTGVARAALLALAPDVEVLAPDEVRADLARAAHAVATRHRTGAVRPLHFVGPGSTAVDRPA